MKTLTPQNSGLLIVDVQARLVSQVERPCEVLHKISQAARAAQIFRLPIFATEQYPQGLGETVQPIKTLLGPCQRYYAKTTFSCLGDNALKNEILALSVDCWILAGLEAHICILQTAKDLLKENQSVVVLNDAISSRSLYDYSCAIAELRDNGARISTTETVLFELLQDSKAPEFKEISRLVQCAQETPSSCCCP